MDNYIENVYKKLKDYCYGHSDLVEFSHVPKKVMKEAVKYLPEEYLEIHCNGGPSIKELLALSDALRYDGNIDMPPREPFMRIDAVYMSKRTKDRIIRKLENTADIGKIENIGKREYLYFWWD